MKCPLCTTKKGKRPCKLTTTTICSLCCGTHRTFDICNGCQFYQPPKRDYKNIPFYRPHEMEDNQDREYVSEVIEEALTTFDYPTEDQMNDLQAIQILEMLLDRFYFGDKTIPEPKNPLVKEGFHTVLKSIQENVSHVTHDELSKIIGAIWFVAKRRTTGRREYLKIIREYVGIRLDEGVHLCIDPALEQGAHPRASLEKLKSFFKGIG